MVVSSTTANSPNLNHRQYFRIYNIYVLFLYASTAIGLFCESILEYLADTELAAKTGITAEMFEGEGVLGVRTPLQPVAALKGIQGEGPPCAVCTVHVPRSVCAHCCLVLRLR